MHNVRHWLPFVLLVVLTMILLRRQQTFTPSTNAIRTFLNAPLVSAPGRISRAKAVDKSEAEPLVRDGLNPLNSREFFDYVSVEYAFGVALLKKNG